MTKNGNLKIEKMKMKKDKNTNTKYKYKIQIAKKCQKSTIFKKSGFWAFFGIFNFFGEKGQFSIPI